MRILLGLALLMGVGCGDDDGADAGPSDAGRDSAADVGEDVEAPDDGGVDAPMDAPPDVAVDAGAIGSAGCHVGAGLPEGETTFMVGGRERTYVLRLPEGYTNERTWPLIFALHGNGGNTSYWDRETGDRNIRGAVSDGAILVVALAIDNQWRDYGMDASTYPARIDEELAYFDAIVETTSDALCIDEDAIFTMGFSGGGSFSGVLGCRREYIRAMAVGGSVIYFDADDCVSTPASWITIGTEELVAGREQFRDFFRDAAGCMPDSAATDPDPCVAYEGCDAETPVHYCQHPDGHIWPAFGVDAAWAFFQTFLD